MGFGDFKLLAALGAWLGWKMILPIVLGASVIGAIVGIVMKMSSALREGRYVPFGPFLAGAGLVVLFAGPERVLGWLRLVLGRPTHRSAAARMSALRIGLTGGIGSGKSTVGTMLARLGAVVIDTDLIARRLTLPGGAAIEAIRTAFGADFIDADRRPRPAAHAPGRVRRRRARGPASRRSCIR